MTRHQIARYAILSVVALTCLFIRNSKAGPPFQASADLILGNERSRPYDGSRLNFGVDLALAPRSWPVRLALFATRSTEVEDCTAECGTLHEKMTQAGIGLRRQWSVRRIQPAVAGGLAWNEQRTDIDPAYDVVNTGYSQRALGWWADVRASLRIADPLHIGGGVRYSRMNQTGAGYSFWYPLWSAYGSLGVTWPRLDRTGK